jgi:ankyrin repeat protein
MPFAAVQVHALVAAGADVTVKNVEGETALDMAAKPGFSEVRRNVRQTT